MKKNYFAVAIAAMIFTGCSNPELGNEPVQPKVAELNFASVVTADLVTRAAQPLAGNFKINLTEDAGGYAAVSNDQVTFNTPNYTTASTIYVASGRDLTAWAPATVEPDVVATAPNKFTLTPGVNATDFVYQKTTAITSENCNNISVTMNHAMAKLTFVLKFPGNYTGPKKIKSLVVNGTPGATAFDIATATWTTPLPTAAPITVQDAEIEYTAGLPVLVVPMTDLTGLTIDCVVNGATHTGIAVSGLTTLAGGTNYEITINVSESSVAIKGAAVEEWVTNNDGDVTLP